MENKVKFNRFNRYIPFPEKDGILRVNTNEDGMNFKSIDELNVEYGRENLMCGFKPLFITNAEDRKLYAWDGDITAMDGYAYTDGEDEFYIDEHGDKVRSRVWFFKYNDESRLELYDQLYSEKNDKGEKVYYCYDYNHRKCYMTRLDSSNDKVVHIDSQKTLKIGAGQVLLHSKIAGSFTYGRINMFNLQSPIKGIKGKHTFEPAYYNIDTTKHYEGKSGGADYSEYEYLRPNMTSENYPYGVCWADTLHANAELAPWKAFNGTTTDGNDCYLSIDPSTGLYPMCLYYSISDTNDKWVRPTCFTITNRNNSGAIRPMATFLIQGSQILHPYDDLDWETLVNVDGTNLTHPATNAGVGTYYVDTEKYYRHFRIKCLTANTTVPSGNTMIAIGDWNIKGYTNDVIDVLNPVQKYFLVNVYNKTTDETYDMYVVSRANIPVLDEELELIDYYPVEYKDMFVNDYKNALFIDAKNAEKIDLTNKSEGEYCVYMVADNKDYYSYKIYRAQQIAISGNIPQSSYVKLVCTFKIGEDGNIVKYYPHDDVVNSYNDRFLIQEQIGSIGYRIYSDGWKEQWGNNANPVFPIAFEEIPVIVERGATNVTRTGMTIGAGYWSVKGY